MAAARRAGENRKAQISYRGGQRPDRRCSRNSRPGDTQQALHDKAGQESHRAGRRVRIPRRQSHPEAFHLATGAG